MAAAAEVFSMLIFVFAGQVYGKAFSKLTDNRAAMPSGLVAASLAHAFALFVAVSVGANVSGGHVNPAYIRRLLWGLFYWIAPLLGSVVACSLLKICNRRTGVSPMNALVFEIVMIFGLVDTFYATAVNPRKGNVGIVAPIAIGLIMGANMLACGAFDGASMKLAVSFLPAVVSRSWTNHWVYWLGPIIRTGFVALVYDSVSHRFLLSEGTILCS